jgi:salicylate biosynthesis isochorismate synthase/menaquinone-specific isochorismate synthase
LSRKTSATTDGFKHAAERQAPELAADPLGAFADEATRGRLAAHLALALARARRSGQEVLSAFSLPLAREVDPSAVVCGARRAGEPWFCFEQPERAGTAVAALGEVAQISYSGPQRFAQAVARWRALSADAEASGPVAPLAVGGFAFAPGGGAAPAWAGFEPATLVVPELALTRKSGTASLSLYAMVAPDDTTGDLLGSLARRIAELGTRGLPLLDPAPAGACRVVSAMPPEHFEAAVARARELIVAGGLEKIVLAREVQVHAPRAHDPAAIFGALREAFPSCFIVCVGRGDAAFVAASPELLLRREGQRVSTMALAGSTRRSADPAVDDHLGEQLMRSAKDREEHAIVARRIEAALQPHALWITASPEPVLVRVANIQHLGTPIRVQLAAPRDAIELTGLLHPTPAVGGQPAQPALELIPALEGLDRGWYAGPVGWVDATGDGELCVALRCALLRGAVAHCYAGVGVVRDSDPAAELAETELKLQALLPLLAA